MGECLLLIGGLEEVLEGGPAQQTIVELLLDTGLLGLDFLDHLKDVVPRDKCVTHGLYIGHLAFDPVKNALEGVLKQFTCLGEVFHQLIGLAAKNHSV